MTQRVDHKTEQVVSYNESLYQKTNSELDYKSKSLEPFVRPSKYSRNREPKLHIEDYEQGYYDRRLRLEFPRRNQIQTWVREEFIRRQRNFGMNYTKNGEAFEPMNPEYDNYDEIGINDRNSLPFYKGPKTSWMRVCSFAIVPDIDNNTKMREGFILENDGLFARRYGFDSNILDDGGYNLDTGGAKTMLGYDINQERHEIIESDYKHRPSPGIISISSEDIEPNKNFRRTNINFVCWSIDQLNYLGNYFFAVGHSVSVEWGWNSYPRNALLPINKNGLTKLGVLWNNQSIAGYKDFSACRVQNRKGEGNCGFTLGMITSYNYSIRDDGGFDCNITISCMSEVGHQMHIASTTKYKKREKQVSTTLVNLRKFMSSTLNKLLKNSADGVYSDSAKDLQMYNKKNDSVKDYLKKVKELSVAQEMQIEYAETETFYFKNVKEIGRLENGQLDIEVFKKKYSKLQVDDGTLGFSGPFKGASYKVIAVEGYSKQESSSDYIVRQKTRLNELDSDWYNDNSMQGAGKLNFIKLYIKRVNADGNDIDLSKKSIPQTPVDTSVESISAQLLSRGRWFAFNPYDSSKHYYRGKSNSGGTYITVGYLIDIVNIFCARKSENGARMTEFTVYDSRCIAHPNIKSCNGDVLLIPNAMAPRHNAKISNYGSTVDYKGDSDSFYDNLLSDQTLNEGTLGVIINSLNETSGIDEKSITLDEALTLSPRDDLHKILSVNSFSGVNYQNPILDDKFSFLEEIHSKRLSEQGDYFESIENINKTAFESKEEAVKPFPDYFTHEQAGSSDGFSGRIADLFVNMNVITESFNKHDTISAILKDIMSKVSRAAGEIWDFDLIGADTNTSSNTVIQLIDNKFAGIKPVNEQIEDAWVFNTHTDDSIVREMNFDYQTSSELSSQIVFGWRNSKFKGPDGQTNIHYKENDDLLLNRATDLRKETDKIAIEEIDAESINRDLPDPEKYIVKLSSSALDNIFPIKKIDKKLSEPNSNGEFLSSNAISYTDASGNYQIKDFANAKDKQLFINKLEKENINNKDLNIKVKEPNQFGSSAIENSQQSDDNVDFDSITKTVSREFTINTTFGYLKRLYTFKKLKNYKRLEDFSENDDLPKMRSALGIFRELVGNRIIGTGTKPQSYGGGGFTLQKGINYEVLGVHDWKLAMADGYFDAGRETLPVKTGMSAITSGINPFGSDIDEDYRYSIKVKTTRTETSTETDPLQSITDTERQLILQTSKVPSSLQSRYPTTKFKVNKDESSGEVSIDIDGKKHKYSNISNYTTNTGTRLSLGKKSTEGESFEIDIEMVDPYEDRMLDLCKINHSPKNNILFNQRLDGFELSLKLDGIEGIRLWDMFRVTGVPDRYFYQGVFQVSAIKHEIQDGDWTTEITAGYHPNPIIF